MKSSEMETEIITNIFNDKNNIIKGTVKETNLNEKYIDFETKIIEPEMGVIYLAVTKGEVQIVTVEKLGKIVLDDFGKSTYEDDGITEKLSTTEFYTRITLDENFSITLKKGVDEIKIIKQSDYNLQKNNLRAKARKDLEDSFQNVDAKYKKHPLNYYMRNVWLWLIFSVTLFTHSIIVYHGFSFTKKSGGSSSGIDLDLL